MYADRKPPSTRQAIRGLAARHMKGTAIVEIRTLYPINIELRTRLASPFVQLGWCLA